MDLQVQTQHAELDPDGRDLIERLAAHISERYPETLRLHVTVQQTPHHRQGSQTVVALANSEGAVLRAEKAGERVRDAIHAVFDALEVEIERHHRQRRHFTKGSRPRLQGSVKRIFRDGGYGFIHYEPGRDVYFNRASLDGLAFDTLEPGHPVEFEIEYGRRGLQAPRVCPAGARNRA
jgi:cold shock CspA family protein/ribosome-associated translation inhibitor RaiA